MRALQVSDEAIESRLRCLSWLKPCVKLNESLAVGMCFCCPQRGLGR